MQLKEYTEFFFIEDKSLDKVADMTCRLGFIQTQRIVLVPLVTDAPALRISMYS